VATESVNEEVMIWVKVDVDFPDHPRLLEFADPDAMIGFWLRGLAYSRRHELDGLVPKAALKLWPGEHNEACAEMLVRAGLWSDEGKHYRIERYEEKGNQTKAQIASVRAKDRERKAVDRSSVQTESKRSPDGIPVLFSDRQDSQASGGECERGEASPREQDYQRAYEAGIAAGKGSPYAMPENQRGALHQGMLAHGYVGGKRVRGPELLAWIERQARQFAAWLVKQDAKTVAFHSSYGPRGWLQWMNVTPAKPIVETKIARAPLRTDLDRAMHVLASEGAPANENASPRNVAQLVDGLAKGWKP